MELADAMRTTFSCRYYAPDPVPDEVFYKAVELARFGPQGGNRQPVRFLIVRDPAKKRRLGELYVVPWREYIKAATSGQQAVSAGGGHEKATWTGLSSSVLNDANVFAEHFGEHPTIIVVCADLAATHPTDTGLGRLSIVGGASVYPTVQNFLLALREQGVATAITTLAVAYEPEVRELLGIPEQYATACHLVAGYPAHGFPKRLKRRPVEELAFVDSFDQPLQSRPGI